MALVLMSVWWQTNKVRFLVSHFHYLAMGNESFLDYVFCVCRLVLKGGSIPPTANCRKTNAQNYAVLIDLKMDVVAWRNR